MARLCTLYSLIRKTAVLLAVTLTVMVGEWLIAKKQCGFRNNGHCAGLVTGNQGMQTGSIHPGNNSWIPQSMHRNPSGPIHLKLRDGTCVPYTNYTFLPLTLTSAYVLNNPDICKFDRQLSFLVVVNSGVQNFDRRKALRETWANSKLLRYPTLRVVFLLGKPSNSSIQTIVEMEQSVHRDIVQGDFMDEYHNLTHKAVMGLRWVSEFCRHAQLVLKVDDDVFLNIFRVIEEIVPVHSNTGSQISCNLHYVDGIVRCGKIWAVDYDYFPNCEDYPFSFCNGGFVLMHENVVPQLLKLAHTTPFIWMDDVYLYGILANVAENITLKHAEGFFRFEEDADRCFEESTSCNMLLVFTKNTTLMKMYWSNALLQSRELVVKYANEEFIPIGDGIYLKPHEMTILLLTCLSLPFMRRW